MFRSKTITLSFVLGPVILITNLQFNTHTLYLYDPRTPGPGENKLPEMYAAIKVVINVDRNVFHDLVIK